MAKIVATGFSLAKGKELKGDDAFEIKTTSSITVAVLCDGVGSAEFGAEAAQRVCHYLVTNLKNKPTSWSMQKAILHFIKSINSILYTESIEQYERAELVTTLALVVIEGERVYGANVGDSRIYILRDEILSQLSCDHNEEKEELSHVLTKAIGLDSFVEPYYFENILKKDDRLLLCSDGVYNLLDDKALVDGMKTSAYSLVKYASKTTDDNLPDDTTAVVLDVEELDQYCSLKNQSLIIPDTLKKGQVIDRYKLLEPLVANERTWACEHSGIKYVMKFAPKEAIDDERILDIFVKEVWNAKRLKAGFFPKAVVPKNRTNRYYIMPFVKGDELKSFIKKRSVSIDEGINLAKFLLHMEQFLLKYDLVHGDIKPENIIRTKRKDKIVFKMVDFGSIVEIFSINSKAGTPSYLSPERFAGDSISEQTEVFSIGVTLYEALTRKLPYGEIEPFSNPTFKKPKPPTKLNPKIPKWLESIILRAISTDTGQRYKNYSEMLYELENPQKVKPYFDKSISLVERNPALVYKIAFIVSFIVNVILALILME